MRNFSRALAIFLPLGRVTRSDFVIVLVSARASIYTAAAAAMAISVFTLAGNGAKLESNPTAAQAVAPLMAAHIKGFIIVEIKFGVKPVCLHRQYKLVTNIMAKQTSVPMGAPYIVISGRPTSVNVITALAAAPISILRTGIVGLPIACSILVMGRQNADIISVIPIILSIGGPMANTPALL